MATRLLRRSRSGKIAGMRSRRPLRSLLVVLCCLASFIKPAIAAAQAHPSFGGTWVRVDSAITGVTVAATGDAAFQIGDMGSGWGTPLTITQSSDSLVVSFAHFVTYDGQPRLRYVFALDGGETVNRMMIGHAESAPRARARWEGATLGLTSRYATPPEVGAAPTEMRQTLSLDAAGRLVVETTRPGARGPDLVRTIYAE